MVLPTADVDTEPVFAEIFAEHARYVWRVLRHLGVAESDVEDVCQDVFLVIHRRHVEFEHRASLRTWIYAICIRKASEYRRRAHRKRETSMENSPEPVAVERGQDGQVDARLKLQRLSGLLENLKAPQRAVFVLFEIEGLSMKEIAEVLDCAPSTAYAWHRDAKVALKSALGRKGSRRG